MKKLVFAAFAAMAIVSASNVFAFNTPSTVAAAADTDTVANVALVDTTDTAAQPVKEVALASDTDSAANAKFMAFVGYDEPDTIAPSQPDSLPAQD